MAINSKMAFTLSNSETMELAKLKACKRIIAKFPPNAENVCSRLIIISAKPLWENQK